MITKVFIKERQECQSQRRCDDIIVEAEVRDQSGLKPRSKKRRQTLKAGGDKEMDTTLKPLEKTQPCQHLNLSLVTSILNF